MKLETYQMLQRVENMGVNSVDAAALRRISMTLNNWFTLECGDGTRWIERDEKTGQPFLYVDGRYLDPKPRCYITPDKERGALRRLEKIMTNYPHLGAYVQGDCRGASLYIYRVDDLNKRTCSIDACYSSIGAALYK